ncbi:MAG: NF038132 family protein [Steroidobacteraceae bacterium]
MTKHTLLSLSVLIGAGVLAAPYAAATGPVPAGWSCTGGCGTDGADGDVPLSPLGNPFYEFVTTTGGILGLGQNPVTPPTSPTNGSLLTTPVFSANAGTALTFYFDFITSDGGMYADNAWAVLFSAASDMPVAQLYNDTTAETPYTIGLSTVSWLGEWSGQCFVDGCGTTGWQSVDYTITGTGNYYLEFGATNALDELYDTGLAIDGVALNGIQITSPPPTVPEPGTLALFGAAALALGIVHRRRRKLSI